jgi:hypothetical protein
MRHAFIGSKSTYSERSGAHPIAFRPCKTLGAGRVLVVLLRSPQKGFLGAPGRPQASAMSRHPKTFSREIRTSGYRWRLLVFANRFTQGLWMTEQVRSMTNEGLGLEGSGSVETANCAG